MADNFVQQVTGTAAGPNPAATLTGVVAGNSLVAFLLNGDAVGSIAGVSDGQGAYTAKGSLIDDTTNAVEMQVFILQNANSGTHVVTGSCPSSAGSQITVVEVGTTAGASAYSGVNGAFQSAPGTGANAISSGSVPVTAAATLVAFSTDSSSTSTSNEPTVGTGFTTRNNGANGFVGAFRLESIAAAANAAGTFTAPTGTDNFVTAAIAILNAASGTAYTLSVAKANVPITGETVNFKSTRNMAVTRATVAVTGQTVNFKSGHTLGVTAATLAVVGETVSFTYTPAGSTGYVLPVGTAIIPVLGAPVFADYALGVAFRSVPVIAQSITLTYTPSGGHTDYSLSVTARAIAVVGQNVSFTSTAHTNYSLPVTRAQIPVVGQVVSLIYGHPLTPVVCAGGTFDALTPMLGLMI